MTVWTLIYLLLVSPDNPPTSIFFRFLASRITTVSFPAVGTYLKDKHMSPSRSLWKKEENVKMFLGNLTNGTLINGKTTVSLLLISLGCTGINHPVSIIIIYIDILFFFFVIAVVTTRSSSLKFISLFKLIFICKNGWIYRFKLFEI